MRNAKNYAMLALLGLVGSNSAFALLSDAPVAAPAARVAPQVIGSTNSGTPAVAGVPTSAPVAAPMMAPASPVIMDSTRSTLREINEKRATLEMLKLDAEIDKMRQPARDAESKSVSAQLAKQLAEARASANPSSSGVITGSSETSRAAMSLTVLSIYGMQDKLVAEMKVGDLLVNARAGDQLPSGHVIRSVRFDSIDVSMGKKGRSEKIYISGSDAAAIYSSRGKNGSLETAAPATMSSGPARGAGAATSLPPLPGAR